MSACRRLPPPSQRRLLCRHMPRLPASPSTAPQATSLPLFSQVKLVLQQNRFFVESPHPEILRKLLADPVVKDAARLDKPGGADGGWPPLLLLSDCCLTWSLASLCSTMRAAGRAARHAAVDAAAHLSRPPAPLPGPLQAPAAASSKWVPRAATERWPTWQRSRRSTWQQVRAVVLCGFRTLLIA